MKIRINHKNIINPNSNTGRHVEDNFEVEVPAIDCDDLKTNWPLIACLLDKQTAMEIEKIS